MSVTLLVADGGGHLTQLAMLAPRLVPAARPAVWVTQDGPQARDLLGDAVMIPGHHPTTRNLRNAFANLRLAQQVLSHYSVSRVVTSGAGLAPPFAVAAARRSIPVHYIETATRVEAPSLSARLVEHLPNVRCYSQHASWRRRGWLHRGSVLDGYTVRQRTAAAIHHVFVSFGTHNYPFDRLAERLHSILPTDVAVTWQLGATSPPAGFDSSWHDFLPAAEQNRLIAHADVVVGHAGMGLAVATLDAGKVPVLVPREAVYDEHVDNHQLPLVRTLADRGLAIAASVDELDWSTLKRGANLRVDKDNDPPRPFTLQEP